jgi:segregation and condensation protein B
VRAALAAIEEHYATRGIQLHAVAGGHKFRSAPQNAAWVQKLLAQKPVRLSRQLLETLAIVSYRQPITRPEIDDIRGVDSGGTLKTLMERSLVRILGKKEEPGRPMLYGTTREFLEFFNLRDLKDLPSLREFHELSDEHRAQVEALESAAPEGAVETQAEADAAAQQNVLSRVDFQAPPEDSAELEEIDRLIRTADPGTAAPEPTPETTKE